MDLDKYPRLNEMRTRDQNVWAAFWPHGHRISTPFQFNTHNHYLLIRSQIIFSADPESLGNLQKNHRCLRCIFTFLCIPNDFMFWFRFGQSDVVCATLNIDSACCAVFVTPCFAPMRPLISSLQFGCQMIISGSPILQSAIHTDTSMEVSAPCYICVHLPWRWGLEISGENTSIILTLLKFECVHELEND